MLRNNFPARGDLRFFRRSTASEQKAQMDLLVDFGPDVVLQSFRKKIGHPQREGIIHQRQCL